MPASLQAKALSVGYPGGPLIIENLSLVLQAGQWVALIGANGSGKSTLLSALRGQLPSRSGSIEIEGQSLVDRPDLIDRIAIAPPADALPRALRVKSFLNLVVKLRNAEADCWHAHADALQLVDWLNRPLRAISLGTRQKVSLIAALIGERPIVLLDETLSGMDLAASARAVDILRARAQQGASILMASHDIGLLAQATDRLLLLDEGRIRRKFEAPVATAAIVSALSID